MDESLLKSEEKAVFALRSLYRRYGYLPFRMSKFEEYELYMRNKDFLVSDRIITFNDTNGKLLALKPDVTLSIIKSGEDKPGCKQKVYYNENVYRVSGSTRQYKEIMQAGLECIGDIDMYDIYEVIVLAAESLSLISDSFVLEISHLGLLSAVLERVCPDKEFTQKAIQYISEKNVHDLNTLCRQFKIEDNMAEKLAVFVTAYGERDRVLKALEEVCGSLFRSVTWKQHKQAEGKLDVQENGHEEEHSDKQENEHEAEYSHKQEKGHVTGKSDQQEGRCPNGQPDQQESIYSDGKETEKAENYPNTAVYKLLKGMEMLSHMLDSLPYSDRIHFDFSVVNDMKYYNGFVFKGFLDGICDDVLTGGQYDKMMARMGRSSGAIGFAIYLDLLEQLPQARADFDVDVLLLYGSDTDSRTVAETVQKLTREGKTVSAQKSIPEKLRSRETVNLITDSADKRGFLC